MDYLFGRPLKYVIKTDNVIRTFGRVLDDFSPGTVTGVGLGITATPNLVKNIREKSPWHQTAADLLVDTGGFIVSEIAGWGAGALAGFFTGGNPVAILTAKVVIDGAVSMGWDYLAERYNWSDRLSQQLEKGACSFGEDMINPMQQALDTEKYPPVPTPPTPLVTGTPTPAGQNPIVQPSGTPMPETSAPSTPIPTLPPTP